MSRLKVLGAVAAIGVLLVFSGSASAKPQLGTLTVQGPTTVKAGGSAVFRVSVQNRGDETAKGIVISAIRGGKGSATIGQLAPDRRRVARVKVKVAGKAGKRVSLRFRARVKGSKAVFSTVSVRLTKPRKNRGGGGGAVNLPAAPQLPSVGAGS